MTLILGVDPGLSGGLAFYYVEAETIEVHDMPIHMLARNGKAKREIDAYGLARLIDSHKSEPITKAYIERVGAMPKQGVSSVFSFGKSTGIALGVVAANFIPIEEVSPLKWKQAAGLTGKGKDASRALAARLFPRQSGLFSRAKNEGLAEATLIAVYGARKHERRAA